MENAAYRSWLDDVIRLVPSGDFEQNLFRIVLHYTLAGAAEHEPRESVSSLVLQAIEIVRDDYPSFSPKFRSALLRVEWPADIEAPEAGLRAAGRQFIKLR